MLNKSNLIEIVAEKANMTKSESERCIDILLETIKENVRDGVKVQLRDFGSFKSKDQEAYTGRNPRTGEPVQVPEKKTIHFKPSKVLKNYLNYEEDESEETE